MIAEFNALLGKTLTAIDLITDDLGYPEKIRFKTDTETFVMVHEQDCCESVYVEDICGDVNDLIGSPIVEAEEVSSNENPPGVTMGPQDSFTWTFYKLRTAKGAVTIRWYGESNGYYSEAVSFYQQ